MASLNFNAEDHDTSQSSTLPLGVYVLEVSASEVKPTKGGTGHLLAVTYDVLEPDNFHGRKMFANINIANDNPTAQKIGQEELAKLCRAIGKPKIADSEELHFQRFTAKVGLEKPSAGYEPRNKITRFYFPDEGELPPAAIDAVQPTAAVKPAANDNRSAPANDNAAPAAKKALPWGKK